MKPYPYPNSVLVLDNACIYHDDGLLEYLDAFDVRIEFLLPYSPNLNPIETAFSLIKNYLKKNRYFFENSYDPFYPLLVTCAQIIPKIAKNYYKASGYV